VQDDEWMQLEEPSKISTAVSMAAAERLFAGTFGG